MQHKPLYPLLSDVPINQGIPAESTKRFELGSIVSTNHPFWGGAEFQYVQFTGTTADRALCVIDSVYDSTNLRWKIQATPCPNTANLGKSLGVALCSATANQYGWVQISGVTPVNSTASVAADTAFGITAAGQVGAVANGKQVLNARVAAPATTTVVKAALSGETGSTSIRVVNTLGWFIGGYVGGTGIGASAKITGLSNDGQTVTLSVANSATVSGNITVTYNNATVFYNVIYLNRPFAQGQTT